MQFIVQSSSKSLQAYKESFIQFRNIIYYDFYRHREASGKAGGTDDHIMLVGYLIEANEAAMDHFGIHRSLWDECTVIALKELQLTDGQARGLLAGFKLPPLRDITTNELLDDNKGAGLVGYKEWLRGGDEVAIAKAEWLWKECSKFNHMKEQLASIGVSF